MPSYCNNIMSFNPGTPQPIQPLSIGNVVSAGLRLYGSHLKSYLGLAFLAYTWLFIPVAAFSIIIILLRLPPLIYLLIPVPFIYGLAKFYATLALISRLAYSELVEQPESVREASRAVNKRLWQFLFLLLLMLLLFLGVAIGFVIIFGIVAFIVGGIFATSLSAVAQTNTFNPIMGLVIFILALVFIVVIFTAILWIQARFIIVELPLAIEDNVDAISTIGRSWDLTKSSVWRIAAITFITYLITLPIQVPFTIASYFIQVSIQQAREGNTNYILLLTLANLAINFISFAIIVPFWQSIKAVLYCDLRSRREGFGLKLRGRNI